MNNFKYKIMREELKALTTSTSIQNYIQTVPLKGDNNSALLLKLAKYRLLHEFNTADRSQIKVLLLENRRQSNIVWMEEKLRSFPIGRWIYDDISY